VFLRSKRATIISSIETGEFILLNGRPGGGGIGIEVDGYFGIGLIGMGEKRESLFII